MPRKLPFPRFAITTVLPGSDCKVNLECFQVGFSDRALLLFTTEEKALAYASHIDGSEVRHLEDLDLPFAVAHLKAQCKYLLRDLTIHTPQTFWWMTSEQALDAISGIEAGREPDAEFKLAGRNSISGGIMEHGSWRQYPAPRYALIFAGDGAGGVHLPMVINLASGKRAICLFRTPADVEAVAIECHVKNFCAGPLTDQELRDLIATKANADAIAIDFRLENETACWAADVGRFLAALDGDSSPEVTFDLCETAM